MHRSKTARNSSTSCLARSCGMLTRGQSSRLSATPSRQATGSSLNSLPRRSRMSSRPRPRILCSRPHKRIVYTYTHISQLSTPFYLPLVSTSSESGNKLEAPVLFSGCGFGAETSERASALAWRTRVFQTFSWAIFSFCSITLNDMNRRGHFLFSASLLLSGDSVPRQF